MDTYQLPVQFYKVLAHPVRLAILEILRDGEQCVCHMEASLGLRQALISQHLMALRDAQLVADRRDGWNIFYHVQQPQVYAVIEAANLLLGQAGRAPIPAAAGCTCPKCHPGPTSEQTT